MYNSFILYTDMGPSVQSLRDAEAGRLVKAIYQYVATGELPEGLKSTTAMCFALIRRSLDRDLAKYEEVCRRRAEAGRAGGLRTQELLRQREANASKATANQAYSESISESIPERIPESISERVSESTPERICGSGNDPVPVPPGAGADSTPTPQRYGKYKNLSFTPEEYKALREEFPEDYERRLERLSEYTASSGKKYASALATIRAWARKEAQDGNLEADHAWTLGNVL